MPAHIPRLLAISDRRKLAKNQAEGFDLGLFLRWIARLAELGVDAVQIREKDLSDLDLFNLVSAIATRHPSLTVLVNGRADIALASGASGVHIPSDGVPVEKLRNRFGNRLIIGVSTHNHHEIETAREDGADYVTYGPIFPTPSKNAWVENLPGLSGLKTATALGLPVLGLGGLEAKQVAAAYTAGAHGIAAIRAFHDETETRHLVALANDLWPRAAATPNTR